ncbi:MAG: isocitrate lyase/phosphoenolpyruvate mutase family protein [Variovorax sp.]
MAGTEKVADPARSGSLASTSKVAESVNVAERRKAFHRLHESGCFVIPNPWDVGSALYLQGLGFKALATTSSGFAWSRGRADNAISRDMALAHLHEMVDALDVPLNADFESGFGADAAGVEESVRLALETGIAGLSIEDTTGNPAAPLFSIDDATERLRAARRAIDKAGGGVLLVGRADGIFAGQPDLDAAIARLKAYANVGADCLYAPGLRTREEIGRVVDAVSPRPVNVLVGGPSDLRVADLAALGVRRISVGGGMARAAWGGFMRAATALLEQGSFEGFAGAAPGAQLNKFFEGDAA